MNNINIRIFIFRTIKALFRTIAVVVLAPPETNIGLPDVVPFVVYLTALQEEAQK